MTKEIGLGGFDINIAKAIRDLKEDLKDDWFPDPIRFRDCLNRDDISKYYYENIHENHGVYTPEKAEIFNVPKKDFLIRYSLETNVYDRLIYLALTSYLIPYYDPLLSDNSFSHRYNDGQSRNDKFLFKHHVEQFKAFEGLIRHSASPNKTILITDVFNYYENIQIAQLKRCLETKIRDLNAPPSEKIKLRRTIELLTDFMKLWSFNGTNGIPQNRDASSFLANILMDYVDREMQKAGFEYFRYMDDIRIVCDDKNSAKRALKLLSETLRAIGLNLNSAKTKIGTLGESKITDSFMNTDRHLEAIDNMWRSRSLELIQKSLPYLRDYTLNLVQNDNTQSRGFRFAIRRIEGILSCEELDIPNDYFTGLTEQIINELEHQPASTDSLIKYLAFAHLEEGHLGKIRDFLVMQSKSIYSWQNYRIWSLFILKNHKHDDLIKYALSVLQRSTKAPDLAGASLYIGKFGDPDQKAKLLQKFQSCKSSWLQRQMLISVHEIPFNQGIREYIAPHSNHSTKGTYGRVREKMQGQYFIGPDKTNFRDLYDGIVVYE